jgi:hypothetical protein
VEWIEAKILLPVAQFETIYPFADGNGWTGRGLIHLVLRRPGLATRLGESRLASVWMIWWTANCWLSASGRSVLMTHLSSGTRSGEQRFPNDKRM